MLVQELTIFDSRSCKRPLKNFFLDNSNIMSSKAQGAKKASGSGGKDPGGGKKAPVGAPTKRKWPNTTISSRLSV